MSAFTDREEAFERRQALSEELRFKALARRNKLLGLWAAEQLGLIGEAASSYARSLVAEQVDHASDEALAASLVAAVSKSNPEISAHRVRRKMDELLAQATKEISAGR